MQDGCAALHNGGQKVFDKVLSINNSSGTGYPLLYFRDEVHHPVDEVGGYASAAMFNATMDITQNRLGFALWSPKSDGTGYTTKSESFTFPVVDVGRTTNGAYRIITTKNIEDIPDADASTRGLVNTGAQTFAGAKSFCNGIYVTTGLYDTNTKANGVSAPIFRFSDAPSANTEYGRIFLAYENNGGRLRFREYSGTSGARTNYYEQYDLPAPNEGRTSNGIFSILTTKDTWDLASGVATSFNIPTSSRHIIFVVGSAGTRDGVFLVRAQSSGAVTATDVSIGSGVTHTQTTNNFTITVTGGGATMYVLTIYGGHITKN